MAREFKVGDKIMAFECHGAPNVGQVEVIITGIIQKIEGSFIMTDRGWFHSKQCRRLVKKQRRRLWVAIGGKSGTIYEVTYDAPSLLPFYRDQDMPGWIEFIEVKKK